MPGYLDGHLYPLERPNLQKALALASGHTRSGKAVMWVCQTGACVPHAQAIQANLKQIGIDVQLKDVPNAVDTGDIGTRGADFDLIVQKHTAVYMDPYQVANVMFDGRAIQPTGNTDVSYFNSPRYNRLIDQAGRLTGSARFAKYGHIAVDLARNAAPVAAFAVRNDRFFVSSRVGCVRTAAHGGVDLAGLCLK